MFFRPTTDVVLVRTHHARAQFVQDAEGSFVSCQPKLPLKLHRRHARRLAGDEVSGPEPDAERRMTALHDGADQETGLAAARTALQNTWSGDNAEGLGDQAAMRADKAVASGHAQDRQRTPCHRETTAETQGAIGGMPDRRADGCPWPP